MKKLLLSVLAIGAFCLSSVVAMETEGEDQNPLVSRGFNLAKNVGLNKNLHKIIRRLEKCGTCVHEREERASIIIAGLQGFLRAGNQTIFDLKDSDGKNLLMYAQHDNFIIEQLIKAAGDDAQKWILQCNNDGHNFFHYLAENGNVAMFKKLLTYFQDQEKEVLLKASNDAQTVLHYAARTGMNVMIYFIIERANKHGILWDMLRKQSSDGYTALHLAAQGRTDGHRDCYEKLIQAAGNQQDTLLRIKGTKGAWTAEKFRNSWDCGCCFWF